MADEMEANPIKVDDATFGDVVGSTKPVLADFTARVVRSVPGIAPAVILNPRTPVWTRAIRDGARCSGLP